MHLLKLENNKENDLRIVWVHGWGTDHKAMLQLATLFQNQAENYLLDLAGFGGTPEPKTPYTSHDYAVDVVNFIKTLPLKKTILIGHSNGGRIAISLASEFKGVVDAIILIAGAGIPKKRGIIFKFYTWNVKTFSPIIKKIFPFLKNVSLGSADYKNSSGVMRETFKNLIAENLSNISQKIEIPTILIYGDLDTATPPAIGEEYQKNIKNSKFYIVKDADHWGLLLNYKSKVHHIINKFIREELC